MSKVVVVVVVVVVALSLSHKYQWNKPSTCPYITYIYDKGVDRTGRQGIEENYSITRGKWGEKK